MDEEVTPCEMPERPLTEVSWGTALNYCLAIPPNSACLNNLGNACRLSSRAPLPAVHAMKIFTSLHDLLKFTMFDVHL